MFRSMPPGKRGGAVGRAVTILVLAVSFAAPLLASPWPVKAAPAITTLTPASGSAGDTVALAGTIDTAGGAYRVRWETTSGATVISGNAASGSTAVNTSFTVPEGTGGAHNVFLEDVSTPGFSPPATFSISPKIALSGVTGAAGSTVTVTGTGYLNSEAGIVVTYDGTAASGTLAAGPLGTWNTSFAIPASVAGLHAVDADGAGGSNPPAVNFTVAPSITLSAYSGSVGVPVNISGAGFRSGEASIVVTWDASTILTSGIVANTLGSWSTGFIVPPVTPGTHYVDAYGNTTTADEVADRSFAAVVPTLAVSPTSGYVGQEITVTGSAFGPYETGIIVTFAGNPVRSGLSADASGAWSTSFILADSPSGAYQYVDAYGSVTSASSVSDAPFSVNPRISLSPSGGAIGTTTTVSGTGFRASESGIAILYDGSVVKSGITASPLGAWSSTFVVPAAPGGSRTVDAYGNSTPSSSVADLTFAQSARIAVTPTTGTSGSTVTVSGTGFHANEGGIAVTWGGVTVKSGVQADGYGSWTTSFVLPATAGGSYTVDAYGDSSPATTVPDVTFAVQPKISLSPTSGPVGSKVTVSGVSFGANETGIGITYEGSVIASGTAASASGDWSAAFTVPPSAAGSRRVGARSSAADVAELHFQVIPEMTHTPVSGSVGTAVTLTGTGFAAGKTVSVTYDGVAIATSPSPLSTSAAGSFTGTLTVPGSTAGAHQVKVSDGAGNSREATFTMEGTPPPLPGLLSPESGARLSMFGNIPVTLDWSDVSDPSGVYYFLEVDSRSDFSTAFVKEEGLTSSNYTTQVKLPLGSYHWRVKAVDGAGNESAWSGPFPLKVGLMPVWLFVFIVVAVIIVLAGLLIVLRRLR